MRHLYTAAEAETSLGIRADRIRQWASRSRKDGTRALYAMGLNKQQKPMYDRDHLLELAGRQ